MLNNIPVSGQRKSGIEPIKRSSQFIWWSVSCLLTDRLYEMKWPSSIHCLFVNWWWWWWWFNFQFFSLFPSRSDTTKFTYSYIINHQSSIMSTISTILTSSVIYRTRHVYSSLLIVLWLVVVNIDANTFIWDPNNTDNIDLVRPFNRHTTFANPPKCVHIPANLTLCHGIKYNEMRIPNLLYHETINEVIEQSSSWIQLIKIGCHPDTQLFLCSLFSPV